MAEPTTVGAEPTATGDGRTGFGFQLFCLLTIFGLVYVAYLYQSFKLYSVGSLVVSTVALLLYARLVRTTKPLAMLGGYGSQLDNYSLLYVITKAACVFATMVLVGPGDDALSNVLSHINDPVSLVLALASILMPLIVGYLLTNNLNGLGLEAQRSDLATETAAVAAATKDLKEALQAAAMAVDPKPIAAAMTKLTTALEGVAGTADAVKDAGQTIVNVAAVARSVERVLDK